MEYAPLEGIVKVGYTRFYDPLLKGSPRYAWEKYDQVTFGSSQSSEDFSRLLRSHNVHPWQIDNIGTENPIPTDIMPNDKLKNLLKALSRPLIIIKKLIHDNDYLPRKFNKKYNVFMDSLFSIEIGQSSNIAELREIPFFLNNIGCTEDDILLLEQAGSYYAPLDKDDKSYILNFLEII